MKQSEYIKKRPVEEMNFEEAMEELTNLVKKLDSENEGLSDAIESFERGMELKSYCESKLKEAKLKVEKIAMKSNGNITTEEISA